MVEKIGAQAQPQARKTGKPQTKPQANQNIVIEFTSLPEKLKTQKVREFYDKDGSGFLESCNSQGQNEISLMANLAKSMGIDLMKYRNPQIAKVEKDGTFYKAKDANNKVIKSMDCNVGVIFEFSGNKKIMYSAKDMFKYHDETNHAAKNNLRVKIYRDGSKLEQFYNDESDKTGDISVGYHKLYDKNGRLIAQVSNNKKNSPTATQTSYEYTTLTSGKNKLEKVSEYQATVNNYKYGNNDYALQIRSENDSEYSDLRDEQSPAPYIKPSNSRLNKTTYTLNGKPVQAKPIGKGRYEVTDEKGNVSYISHDGVKLKPEYVRNNP